MATPVPQQRLFVTTGRHGSGVEPIDALNLRPAMLACYRDVARLRHDYPLVLVSGVPATGAVQTLTAVVDGMLRENAPQGIDGERLRRHVLRLEREVRVMTAAGETGLLSELWTKAASRFARDDDASAEQVLLHLAARLPVDGELVDCDSTLVPRLFGHLWHADYLRKRAAFRATVERLVVRLSDILRASFLGSEAGRRPASLQAALGGTHRELFDFDLMSQLLGRNAASGELPAVRRARLERTLDVLRAQRFFNDSDGDEVRDAITSLYCFDDCANAAAAFRARVPELVDVIRAIAVAELEVDGRYVEDKHDPYFEGFDASMLSGDDFALFPDYLVCIPPGRNDAPENGGLLELLSSGMPIRVVVQATDVVEDAVPGAEHFAFGVRSMRLANTATGLGGVFVVQAAASHLPALRDALQRAFAHRGATLVSTFAPASAGADALPSYLIAAAANDARAFPAFVYDPYAGDNQAARFSLLANPQPDADWPVSGVEYADLNEQRVVEAAAFGFVDFALCDRRYARHFARVPRDRWNAALVPAAQWLEHGVRAQMDLVPYVLAADGDDRLHRVVVDARLMQIAARVRTFWHRLQEQGGIHNSYAALALARERAKWEAEFAERQGAVAPAGPGPLAAEGSAVPAAEPAPVAADTAAPAHSADEAWIETSRCPSCNECQTINDRMFKYNDNKQAYIADITAGSYRQLVEAAEACQVAIIHPGKPRDPSEPGLDELIERAKPFMA